MAYTGLDSIMANLKLVGYSMDNPLIINSPSILLKRRKIQDLYNVLSSMIGLLFVENENDIHELEQVRNLKARFKDVAQEAHSIVGRFVYDSNLVSLKLSIYDFMKYFLKMLLEWKLIKVMSLIYRISFLNLENVMRALESIRDEFISIDLSLSTDPALNSKDAAIYGNSLARNRLPRKKEVVVGLDSDADLIRDQLLQDQKNLVVTSIVGMGGLGKTTLATKVFDDPWVSHSFHIRAWVTVSQKYDRRDCLIQILTSIDVELDPKEDSYFQLHEKLHKILKGRRYLIVIDDIWSIAAWNDLKRFFQNDNTGSRILLTSRLKAVALYATSNGFVHRLTCLTVEKSWELLHKKVFHGYEFPEWLIEPGMRIAEMCHGLPLAVVVVAGFLAQEEKKKDFWEEVGGSLSSCIKSDQNGYLDTLALSYNHLPHHLRECFLYLGGFPRDFKFCVEWLIWLWVAEGFIQETGNQSLEETAEDYLMELVDRNLVLVVDTRSNGSIKTCSVHGLLREFCLKKAKEELFSLNTCTLMRCLSLDSQNKPSRIFTNIESFVNNDSFDQQIPRVRSLFVFNIGISMIKIPNSHISSFPLLMVLDIQMCPMEDFPEAIQSLVHLRYLAFWYAGYFPNSICNLWNLQTLIVKSFHPLLLPKAISNLVNLRHLMSDRIIHFRSINKPMNLRTISMVALVDNAENWDKYIPRIKKLTASTRADEDHDFKSLSSLEKLKWVTVGLHNPQFQKIHMSLPVSLKKLSLAGCYLPWSDMSIVQSLPNLMVLKILQHAFLGPRWETGVMTFQKLTFLKLQGLDIQHWEAYGDNFPCLKRLVLEQCEDLEEIPLDLGNIPTLELIEVDDSSSSVVESLDRIQEDQHYFGNYDLKIIIKHVRSFYFSPWRLEGLR